MSGVGRGRAVRGGWWGAGRVSVGVRGRLGQGEKQDTYLEPELAALCEAVDRESGEGRVEGEQEWDYRHV